MNSDPDPDRVALARARRIIADGGHLVVSKDVAEAILRDGIDLTGILVTVASYMPPRTVVAIGRDPLWR